MAILFHIEESKIIRGVYIIEPNIATDMRGNIWTSFLKDQIQELLPEGMVFKHDKFSRSKNNVLRGIHGDTKSWKYVTCVYGEIYQVIVDMRPSSETYHQWQSFDIKEQNQKIILMPPMMGNAYYVMSSEAVYHYKLAYEGDYFDANDQFSIKWNDPQINISWPSQKPILSPRDQFKRQ